MLAQPASPEKMAAVLDDLSPELIRLNPYERPAHLENWVGERKPLNGQATDWMGARRRSRNEIPRS